MRKAPYLKNALLSTDSFLKKKEHLKKKKINTLFACSSPLKSKIHTPSSFCFLREVLTAARRNGTDSETPKEPSRQPAQS